MKSNCFKTIEETSKIVSLSPSTILAWAAQGKFPKAVKLSRKKRVWHSSDIDEWVNKMHQASQVSYGDSDE
jgi:predicted DNA-binding transcriptional regulator AlpA